MNRDRFARAADREEVFIYSQGTVIAIVGLVSANKAIEEGQNTWMIDEPFEYPAKLVDLLVTDSAVFGM